MNIRVIMHIDISANDVMSTHDAVYASNVGHMVYSKLSELRGEASENDEYYIVAVEVD